MGADFFHLAGIILFLLDIGSGFMPQVLFFYQLSGSWDIEALGAVDSCLSLFVLNFLGPYLDTSRTIGSDSLT